MFLFHCECRHRDAQCNWEINLWEKSPVCKFKFKTFTFCGKTSFFFAILLIHISLQATWFSNKVNYLFIYSSIIHNSATFFTHSVVCFFHLLILFTVYYTTSTSTRFDVNKHLDFRWDSFYSLFIVRDSSLFYSYCLRNSMSRHSGVLRPSDWVSVRSW